MQVLKFKAFVCPNSKIHLNVSAYMHTNVNTWSCGLVQGQTQSSINDINLCCNCSSTRELQKVHHNAFELFHYMHSCLKLFMSLTC